MVDSGERAVELGDYLGILRRRWLGVLIIALTTLALASAVTLAMPKKYTATTRLFIAVAGETQRQIWRRDRTSPRSRCHRMPRWPRRHGSWHR